MTDRSNASRYAGFYQLLSRAGEIRKYEFARLIEVRSDQVDHVLSNMEAYGFLVCEDGSRISVLTDPMEGAQ